MPSAVLESTSIYNNMNKELKRKKSSPAKCDSQKSCKLVKTGDDEMTIDPKRRLRSVTPPPIPKRCRSRAEGVQFYRNFLDTTSELGLKTDHALFPQFPSNAETVHFDEVRLYPKCKIGSPKWIYISPRESTSHDLCKLRTFYKESSDYLMLRAMTSYKAVTKKSKEIRKNEKLNIFHKSLYDFTERLEQNPNEFFSGKYDYYYTGGNLNVLTTTQHIVHVDGENLNNLHISKFDYSKPKGSSRLENCTSRVFKSSSEIFEVVPIYIQKKENEDCFAIRQMNSVLLCSWQPENNEIKNLFQFKGKKIPFVSFCQPEKRPESLLISNMNQEIRLYNICTGSPDHITFYQHNDEELTTSWNCVRHWEDQNYLFANEKRLSVLDTRCSPDQWLTNTFRGSRKSFECDFISCLSASQISNYIYIGTHHKLHCVDLRRLGESFESTGAVTSWTHMMQYPPSMIENMKIKSTEYITLSSNWPGDIKICELLRSKNLQRTETNNAKYLFKSTGLPYEPPTLQEAYDESRLIGNCIDPNADVARRIQFCTTGLKYIKKPDDMEYRLLFATSMGDVFSQNFGKRDIDNQSEERTSEKSNKYMKSLAKNLLKKEPRKLNYSSFADFPVMRKILACEGLSNKDLNPEPELEDNENDMKIVKTQRYGRWHKSFKALQNYKDALVPSLLSIWDVESENDDKIYIKEESLKTNQDSKSKVSEWLQKMNEKAPIPANSLSMESTELNDTAIEQFLNSSIQPTAVSQANDETLNQKINNLEKTPPLNESSTLNKNHNNEETKTRLTRSSKKLLDMLATTQTSPTSSPKLLSSDLPNIPATNNSLIDFTQSSICYDSFAELPHSTQISMPNDTTDAMLNIGNDSTFIGLNDRTTTSAKPDDTIKKRPTKKKTKFVKGFC